MFAASDHALFRFSTSASPIVRTILALARKSDTTTKPILIAETPTRPTIAVEWPVRLISSRRLPFSEECSIASSSVRRSRAIWKPAASRVHEPIGYSDGSYFKVRYFLNGSDLPDGAPSQR
jgi:hypothetical protein